MSIKLYDGFKLKGITTLQEASIFIENIRKPLKERIFENIAKEIKTLACLMYDLQLFDFDMFEPGEDRMPLLAATMRLMESDRNKGQSEFSIGLCVADEHILGYPFFPDNGYIDIVTDHPRVIPFGYWDNTDPDENTTEKEWE